MNKKFFFSLSSLALAIVLAVCGVSVYAWFSATDRASEMEFKFARINSEVYFYRANDENKNGVPDRIEEGYWTDKNITNFPEAYFPEFRGAYSFEFIGKREAKVEDLVTTEDTISFSGESGNSLADIVPSKVFTYRFRMVNKGDSTNNVSIRIYAGSGATTDQAKLLLKTLAVSCGEAVVSRDTSGINFDTVRFSDYQYLKQMKEDGIAVLSDYPLSGMDAQMAEDKKANNEKQIVNTRDFWIRFQMIPYEELIKNNIISEAEFPKDTYQSLQGSTNIEKLIDFSVLFQVKTSDPSVSA